MKTHRVDTIKNFLAPNSAYWARVPVTQVDMMPAPLAMQPTEYVRNSWENKAYGQTAKIAVASVHDGETWALRATWSTPPGETAGKAGTPDFPDALALALPVRNNPVFTLMGSEDAPIHYLRWSADEKNLLSLLATGIGKSQPGPALKCSVQAAAEGNAWQVVMTRALGTGKDIAPLQAGKKTGIGFALWRGANEERAGLKAFSIDWIALELQA